jgi:YD repeat-containing protein
MVAVFTGLGAGFERGSAAQIGPGGVVGGGTQGRGGDSVSVNAANGNLLISRQDEFLIGRGPDVGISRTYNSKFLTPEDNNDHWRQSTDRRLVNRTGGYNANGATISRISADGSEIKYTYSAGAYRTTEGDGAHDTITYGSSTFTWTDGASGIKETYKQYAGEWRIYQQTDRDGDSLTFRYSSAGKLTSITTADGSKVEYHWSGNNITSMKSTYKTNSGATKTLTRTRYNYDAQNRLVKVTTDLTPDNNSISDGKTYETTYAYVDATSKLVATIEQTDGSKMDFAYDSYGRITRITQLVEGADVRETRIGYSRNGTTAAAAYGGVTSVTSPNGMVTKLYHDAKGQLTQIVAPPSEAGGTSDVTQFEYDAAGNLTRTIKTDTENGSAAGNLIDTANWGGGTLAVRGEGLVNDDSWPTDLANVPSGTATLDGWANNYAYHQETEWARTAGPYGGDVVSMKAGQTNATTPGGGGVSNLFSVDASQAYEFTYYFKVDALKKHRTYFGLYGGVVDGASNSAKTNPYFASPIPSAANGMEAGKWYKLVGYVLPNGTEVEPRGSYGGIYDTETGERISDVNHFRWNETAGNG